nr:MAG TPA: Prominin [Caudoviricetes sp.]
MVVFFIFISPFVCRCCLLCLHDTPKIMYLQYVKYTKNNV